MNGNPWCELPDETPFILPQDKDKVDAHNAKQDDEHRLRLDLIPEPFVGREDAPLVILGNNPGASDLEAKHKRKPGYAIPMRNNLLHKLSADCPFLFLDPALDISPRSRRWWKVKLWRVVEEFQQKDTAWSLLARNILAVEFFPYVSERYNHDRLRLDSQLYSFDLVRSAMCRGAVIVLTRGVRRWCKRVEGLEGYRRLVRLKEVQKAPISEPNCRDGGWSHIQAVVSQIEATAGAVGVAPDRP